MTITKDALTADNPPRATFRPSAPSDEQIIEDTIREES